MKKAFLTDRLEMLYHGKYLEINLKCLYKIYHIRSFIESLATDLEILYFTL